MPARQRSPSRWPLLIGLTEIETADAKLLTAAAAVFCISMVAFVWQERRAIAPLVSFSLWSHRPIAATNVAGLLAGMALVGLTTLTPMYVQIALGRAPVVAGLALTTMLVGWPVSATVATRLFHRFALNRLLRTGAMIMPVGASFFVFEPAELAAERRD